MTAHQTPNSPNHFRIALQSALAAAVFLGLPAGLLLWFILLRANASTASLDPFIEILQINGVNKIIVLMICSLGWSFSLGRISGYHPAWKIGLAALIGILLGWISPLSNMDGWFNDEMPVHTLYAITMCGLVFSVSSCVGLSYGLLLRNIKAALTLSLVTGFVTALTMFLSIVLFDQFGIRVGMGNFAMSKVTAPSLMLSAIMGGAVLGVGFSWFIKSEKD